MNYDQEDEPLRDEKGASGKGIEPARARDGKTSRHVHEESTTGCEAGQVGKGRLASSGGNVGLHSKCSGKPLGGGHHV